MYVLTALELQKWLLIKDEEPDRMIFTCDVQELAKSAFASAIWVRFLNILLPYWIYENRIVVLY